MARRKLTGIDEDVARQYKERLKLFEGKETAPLEKDKRIKEKREEVQPAWLPKLRRVTRPEDRLSKKPSPSQRTFQEKMKIFESGARLDSKTRRQGEGGKKLSVSKKEEERAGKRSSSRVKSTERRTSRSGVQSRTSPGVTWAPSESRMGSRKVTPRSVTPYPREKSRSSSKREEGREQSRTREKLASRSVEESLESVEEYRERVASRGASSPRTSERPKTKSPSAARASSLRERSKSKGISQQDISPRVSPGRVSRVVPSKTKSPSRGKSQESTRRPSTPRETPTRSPSAAPSSQRERSTSRGKSREPSRGLSSPRETPGRVSEASSKTKSPSKTRATSSQIERPRASPSGGLDAGKSETPREKSPSTLRENFPSTARDKSRSTPGEKSRSAPRENSPSMLRDKSPSTPRQKSRSTPRDKSPSTTREKSRSTPRDKSPSMLRDKSPSTPRQKSRSKPRDKSPSTTREKSRSTPRDKSPSMLRYKSPSTPRQKSRSTPRDKSPSTPRQKSRSTPREISQPPERVLGTPSESESSVEASRTPERSSNDSWERTPSQTKSRRNSAPQPLMPDEYIFHDIVSKGLISQARTFLRSHKIDINAQGHDGVTALQIAVENGDEAMTAFLISQPNIETDDVLLHAVQVDNLPIVKLLCEHIGPPDEMQTYPSSPSFPPDTTPLQLAAIRNSYEIIDYLINKRNHTLDEPHSPDCVCLECIEARKDLLEMATRRLRQHKAVSTPAYYIHITSDPIYHSFKLYKYLKKMSRVDIVLRPSYVEIADVVRQFSVDLIAECRTSREVRSVLSQFGSSSKFWGKLTKSEWPRLIMAMDYKQKEFVAHSNVQVLLEDKWSGQFYAWRKAGKLRKTISPIIRIFVLPYIYFLLLMRPESDQARHYALPVNKMISFLATYILFLIFVFFQANETRKARRDRPYFFSEENSVYIFVFTYTISIARQIFVTHPKRFFSQGWNIYDVVMISLFWLTLAFWMSSFVHYLMLPTDHMKNLERKYWNAFDPMLVADGFFVLASIMAFLKLLFYFQLNFAVGPMQVALNVMVKDCAKYSLFITLIIFAFTAALGKYYGYYYGMKYVDPVTGDSMEQETNSFTDLRSTFKCLFWGMFGMSDFSAADVIVENVHKPGNETGSSYLVEHNFTEFIGYFAFGGYTILMTVVVINMLIATMSNTFAKVIGNLDTEWMVGRTEVYLYYFYQTILPPPLNILPHRYPPKSLIQADDEEKLLKHELESEEDYDEVAKRLVARYFAKLGRAR